MKKRVHSIIDDWVYSLFFYPNNTEKKTYRKTKKNLTHKIKFTLKEKNVKKV